LKQARGAGIGDSDRVPSGQRQALPNSGELVLASGLAHTVLLFRRRSRFLRSRRFAGRFAWNRLSGGCRFTTRSLLDCHVTPPL